MSSGKKNKKLEEKEKKSGAGKPISLWGAPFTEVLDALLKTKPMPKSDPEGFGNGRKKLQRRVAPPD